MSAFIGEALIEENTSSKCIRTKAQHVVVQFDNCSNTKRMSADTKQTGIPEEYEFMQHKDKSL